MFNKLKKRIGFLSTLFAKLYGMNSAESRSSQKATSNHAVLISQTATFGGGQLGEVLYLEADDSCTTVVTPDLSYAIALPISTVLDRLDNGRLTRTHQAFAVNLDQVDSFTNWHVRVGEYSLPLDRTYRTTFLEHFPY